MFFVYHDLDIIEFREWLRRHFYLYVDRVSFVVDHLEGVRAVAVHVPKAVRGAAVRKQERNLKIKKKLNMKRENYIIFFWTLNLKITLTDAFVTVLII